MRSITLDHRLTVAVPGDLHRAVRALADARGLSVSDFARCELQRALAMARIPFDPVPDLDRPPTRRGGRS